MLDLVSASLRPSGSSTTTSNNGSLGQILGVASSSSSSSSSEDAGEHSDLSRLVSEDVETQYDAFQLDSFVRNVLGGEA